MSARLKFDGRVAVVTGAGSSLGLGASHARSLANRGCRVVVNDVAVDDQFSAERIADEINTSGGVAIANNDSVATPEGAESIVASAIDRFGRLDIVVNNAGISTAPSFPKANDLTDMMRHLEVHLIGAFNVCRAAWPNFVDNRYGRIINTTSSALLGIPADVDPSRSTNVGVSYASAKSALVGLTKCLALLNPDEIKANAVAPAATTRMGAHNATVMPDGERVPLDPGLVSAGVVLLAHESCPVNGEILGMGGGRVDRFFISITAGYVDAELTPERLLDNWERVMSTEDAWLPPHSLAHAEAMRQARVRVADESV